MLSLSYDFSLCGGNPQNPRTVHITWNSATNSFQEILIPELTKTLPFSVDCSEASNKM